MNIYTSLDYFIKSNPYATALVSLVFIISFILIIAFKIIMIPVKNVKQIVEQFSTRLDKVDENFLIVVTMRSKIDYLMNNFSTFEKIIELFKSGELVYTEMTKELERLQPILIKFFVEMKEESKTNIIINDCFKNIIKDISNASIDCQIKEKLMILASVSKDFLSDLLSELFKTKNVSDQFENINFSLSNLKSLIDYFRIESVRFSTMKNNDEIKNNLIDYYKSLGKFNGCSDEELRKIMQGYQY